MIVDKKGNLFEDRRKRTNDRRKDDSSGKLNSKDRRKEDRRKEDNKIR